MDLAVWLTKVFRLWYGFNSGLWDDQASDLMGQLAIAHVDPGRSDPSLIDKVPRAQFNTAEQEAKNPNHVRLARGHKARLLDVAGDIVEDEDGVNYWSNPDNLPEEPRLADPNWTGIRKDIGIFTEQEFEFLMSKCLRSLSKFCAMFAQYCNDLTSRCSCWRQPCFVKRDVDNNGRQQDEPQNPRR